jgi:chromate transporter
LGEVSRASLQADGVGEIPRQSLGSLFLRFLRFGVLAWGGPFAQIAMIRQSLVEEERWVSSAHFNRVLALYQVLPGPEAHELCVYFGMLARGRLGGLLAGLGFMLPGFLLMFLLSWAYLDIGLDMQGRYAFVFAAIQAAVIALIVRAVHRIGSHVLLDRWLWIIGVLAFVGQLIGVHFGVLLLGGGIAYYFARRNAFVVSAFCIACAVALAMWWALQPETQEPRTAALATTATDASLLTLFWSGLKAGALTFGGAYTAIPLLQRDAVFTGGWMTNSQFMDGIALSGLLPAPLIIFSTFVGYLGGGATGALVVTFATFFPAFAFTLFAHEPLERLVREPRIRTFLEGLTAAVVGLIAATAVTLLATSITSLLPAALFAAAVGALFYWNSKWLIPLVVGSAAAIGLVASVLVT